MNTLTVSHTSGKASISGRFMAAAAFLLVVAGLCLSPHSTRTTNKSMGDQQRAGALIKIVRQATERFKDVSVAEKKDMHFNLVASCRS